MVRGRAMFGGGMEATGPRGHRAYAVGDIHGRLDLLDELLEKIEGDSRRRGVAKTSVIFLGDLIDRGPDSSGVVERLRLYRPSFARPLFIMGNHEEVLLRVLAGETELLADWLQFGGAECARSYGLDPEELQASRVEDALTLLQTRIPKQHVKFLSSFVDMASFGTYVFVHAGIRPGIALADQTSQDLRWIRAPFLADESDHGCVVVHGHTITPEVDVRENRIGLDTGAYHSGKLTALGIEGDQRWLIQTGIAEGSGAQPRVAKLSEAN